jgi:hypothetical protein
MYSPSNTCPQCRCASVRRSRRRFYDWPMALFGLKASRCTSCGLRFYRVRRETHSTASAA